MSISYQKEMETALEAVVLASRVCRSVQATMIGSGMEKADSSPVTVADYASQAIICRALRGAFPDDPIVAEEDAAGLRDPDQTPYLTQTRDEIRKAGLMADESDVLRWIDFGNHDATASRYWTLDPIDGTKGFLRKEQFAVSLALIVEGQIQVAALACPNLPSRDAWDNACGVVFTAIRGQGAKMMPLDLPQVTPHSVRVSGTGQAAFARVCESVESGHSSHDHSARITQRLGILESSIRMDSQAKYGVVARGQADIYLRLPTRKDYSEKIWDHAGGVLVVEEAGGRVTDVDGRPLDFSQGPTLKANRGVVVTNGLLHNPVLAAVRAVLEEPTVPPRGH